MRTFIGKIYIIVEYLHFVCISRLIINTADKDKNKTTGKKELIKGHFRLF